MSIGRRLENLMLKGNLSPAGEKKLEILKAKRLRQQERIAKYKAEFRAQNASREQARLIELDIQDVDFSE